MTRSLRHLSVTLAVAAVLVTAAGCGSSDDSGSSDTTAAARGGIYGGGDTQAPAAETTAAGAASSAPAAEPPAAGGGAVTIKDFAFDPGDDEVAAGTTVTWTNEDGAAHRIKSDDGSFDSEDLAQSDTFEHTFDTAGTFDYICGIHPSMTGTITVTG